MTEFKKIDLSAKKAFAEALEKDPARTENSSFATNFLWEDYYNITYAETEGCIVLRYEMDGETSFAFPFGGSSEDKIKAVKSISRLCRKNGIPLYLGPVTEKDKELLEARLPGFFSFNEERSEFEYVYRKEKLIGLDEFSDLRYKKKLIRQLENSGELRYEKLHPQNVSSCMEIEDIWLSDKMKDLSKRLESGSLSRESYDEEKAVLDSEHQLILKAFENFEALGLFGGFLTLEGKPIAFTMAEEQTKDTVIVHIEKALKGIKGAYQAINNYFVSESCEKYSYINREEDTGDANLRQAKMSYRPDNLVKIFSAEENTPVFRFLEKEEYQNTKKICEDIFTGEENKAFFDEFFKAKIYETRTAVLELNGKIISMTQVWNMKAPYFYATATLPEYRLMGFRNMLFEKLFPELEKEGAKWVFLAPENKNIWGDLGFNISFDVSEKEKEVLEIDDDISICLVHEIKPGSFTRPDFF